MSRIKSLVIENYRSIEHIQFSFEDMVAFVGPNNSGKTNILRAINWFLTPYAKLDQEDFLNKEKSNICYCGYYRSYTRANKFTSSKSPCKS